jgi:hypothetical protein
LHRFSQNDGESGFLESRTAADSIPRHRAQQLELPQPQSLLPSDYFDWGSQYFYTFGSLDRLDSLDSVVEVTPCLSEVKGFEPVIVGLIFRYKDGRRASIGQIRLDRFQPALEVDIASMGMCLRFVRSAQGFINVIGVDVQTCPPSDEQVYDARLEVPWQGKLEWWFSHRESWVCHEFQSSPMPYERDWWARQQSELPRTL